MIVYSNDSFEYLYWFSLGESVFFVLVCRVQICAENSIINTAEQSSHSIKGSPTSMCWPASRQAMVCRKLGGNTSRRPDTN